MKRALALLLALLLCTCHALSEDAYNDYSKLIDYLKTGEVELADRMYARLRDISYGQRKIREEDAIHIGIGDSIEMESYSLNVEKMFVIEYSETPFDASDLGGPSNTQIGMSNGNDMLAIVGHIQNHDEGFILKNHFYGYISIGEHEILGGSFSDEAGDWFMLDFNVPDDVFSSLDNSCYVTLFLKNSASEEDKANPTNYDAIYRISIEL